MGAAAESDPPHEPPHVRVSLCGAPQRAVRGPGVESQPLSARLDRRARIRPSGADVPPALRDAVAAAAVPAGPVRPGTGAEGDRLLRTARGAQGAAPLLQCHSPPSP